MAIIPCRECAHQVSDQAASCPSCGAPISTGVKSRPRARQRLARVLVTLMTLWTLGTLLWLILPSWAPHEWITHARLSLQAFDRSDRNVAPPTAAPSAAAGPSGKSQGNAISAQPVTTSAAAAPPTQPAPAPRAVYRTTAEQLYKAYEANAVAVQTRIGTSLVRMTGNVAAIDQDLTGHPVVKLWTGKGTSAAMTLSGDQRAAAAQLVKGESVAVECDKIGGTGAELQGSGCNLAFVDIRTREVNLALFLANESGAAHVYVVGPMPETVCQARSAEISSRLRGQQRGEHVVWRNCTEAARESILPDGCHLNSPAVTVADVPSAQLWRYDCSSSVVARSVSHRSTRSRSRRNGTIPTVTAAPAIVEAEAEPASKLQAPPDNSASVEGPQDATAARAIPLPAADARAVEVTPPSPVTNNLRLASSAAGSDIGGPTAAGQATAGEVTVAHAPQSRSDNMEKLQGGSRGTSSPQPTAALDDLAQVRVLDPQAADHIATYCSKTIASTNREAYVADCRRNEIAAWTRLVLQNEFPTLNDATRRKCSEPPFPDTYVAKESCARYELHAN
jgi:hypothetical protein